MPELPEVEIARRHLARWSRDRRVVDVRLEDRAAVRARLTSRPSAVHPAPEVLRAARGRPEVPVRHGKRLGWRLGEIALLVHLGMTGKWVRRGAEAPRYGRVGVALDDGAWLWFVDPRRFGCIVPVPAAGLPEAVSAGLGPDALLPLPADVLRRRFRTRRPVKEALMDQARLAGLGNIQATEVLWRACVHPRTPADAADWERLAVEIPAQLEETLAQDDGEELTYLQEADADNPFAVYGRRGEPCPRCGTVLLAEHLGGRVTTWCPTCQGDAPERT